MNQHLNLLFAAFGNIIRNKVRSIAILLCLIAVLFPFICAMAISEGIKFQSLISVKEGADIYVTSDHYGSNAPISLHHLKRFQEMEGVVKVYPRVVGRTYFSNRLAKPLSASLLKTSPNRFVLLKVRCFEKKER